MPYKDKSKQREYMKRYNKEYYHKNVKASKERISKWRHKQKDSNGELVKRHKVFVGCKVCGYKKHDSALDYHHIDEKKYSVSNMIWSYSREAVKEEIRKCVVLCANCHREVHAGITQLR